MPVEPFIGDTKAYASDCYYYYYHYYYYYYYCYYFYYYLPLLTHFLCQKYLCYSMPNAYLSGGDNSK